MIRRLCRLGYIAGLVLLIPRLAAAQAAAPNPDAPSISVGATVYMDYTYTSTPTKTDVDGNSYHPSSFNVSRTYINFNGKVSRLVTFRITPDIQRQTNGDLGFRLKYGFMQLNLDQWTMPGTWIRFGQNQTPYIDYEEGIYRYRFQGTTFTEREGYMTSSDDGVTFHSNFKSNFGEVMAGIYNGEGYHSPEANSQPSLQVRGTFRPFAKAGKVASGFNVSGFYDADAYANNDEKKRGLVELYFEHPNFRAAFTYLDTKDQKSAIVTDLHGRGWSVWATPRYPFANGASWEGLVRYDHMTPNIDISNQIHKRLIAGLAYWFPHTGGPAAGIMVDVDDAKFDNLPAPEQRNIAVQGVINF